MPIISFSVMKEKLVSGEKCQTIRPKRSDYWLKFSKGDPVFGYWKLRTAETEKLFESQLVGDPLVIRWADFDDDLMRKDSFDSLKEANEKWFIPRYGENGEIIPDKEFIVLGWERRR